MRAWKSWSGGKHAAAAITTVAALSSVLAAYGCSVQTHGELTYAQCDNDIDDDHDGLRNCADPDCWVFDVCSKEKQAMFGVEGTDDAGNVIGDAADPESQPLDAPLSSELDASSTASADGGFQHQYCGVDGGLTCADDEFCLFGHCAPKKSKGPDNDFLLNIKWASFRLGPSIGVCFDSSFRDHDCAGPGVVPCVTTCLADPYVIVLLNGMPVHETSVVKNVLNAKWKDPAFPITLKPGDTLSFRVMDKDPDDNELGDDEIFSCSMNIEGPLASGGGGCSSATTLLKDATTQPDTLTVEFSKPGDGNLE